MCTIIVFIIIVATGYLYITDKPITNDFIQRNTYKIHNLTYYVPTNWEFAPQDSTDTVMYHARYNNFGKWIGYIGIKYEGDVPDINIDNVISHYTSNSTGVTTVTRDIGGQEFYIVTYPEVIGNDTYLCYAYITETESSVFQFFFKVAEKYSQTEVFDKIIQAVEFDQYINPNAPTETSPSAISSVNKEQNQFDYVLCNDGTAEIVEYKGTEYLRREAYDNKKYQGASYGSPWKVWQAWGI